MIYRALHAVMVAWVRQRGDKARLLSPFPFAPYIAGLLQELRPLIEKRVGVVDAAEKDRLLGILIGA